MAVVWLAFRHVRKHASRRLLVGFHLCFQFVNRVKTHFGANAFYERNAHVLSINIGREIEDIGFDGYTLAVESGSIADVGHAHQRLFKAV